jgi:hypothetical protein
MAEMGHDSNTLVRAASVGQAMQREFDTAQGAES